MMLKTSDFDGYSIPAYMQGGILRYVNNGIMPGSFTSAVLANDLDAAYRRADEVNAALVSEYLRFFGAKIPAIAWGSDDAVSAWCASFRVRAEPVTSAQSPVRTEDAPLLPHVAWPFPTAPEPVESTPEPEPAFSSGGGGNFGGGGASSSWSDSSSSSSSSDSSSSSSSDSGSCSSSSD